MRIEDVNNYIGEYVSVVRPSNKYFLSRVDGIDGEYILMGTKSVHADYVIEGDDGLMCMDRHTFNYDRDRIHDGAAVILDVETMKLDALTYDKADDKPDPSLKGVTIPVRIGTVASVAKNEKSFSLRIQTPDGFDRIKSFLVGDIVGTIETDKRRKQTHILLNDIPLHLVGDVRGNLIVSLLGVSAWHTAVKT